MADKAGYVASLDAEICRKGFTCYSVHGRETKEDDIDHLARYSIGKENWRQSRKRWSPCIYTYEYARENRDSRDKVERSIRDKWG